MPELLANDHSCVTCVAGQQLDSLIITLLATKAGLTLPDDLDTLVEDTACLRCLVDTQLNQRLADFLWQQNAPDDTLDELQAQGKCLQCVDPQTIKVLTHHLLVLGLT